ncbi:hypothetical protein CWC29_004665 [Pseudoalteromonas sp. S4498]|uniref:Carrier domain-containing protein n=2 Tax=Pseudoalteromonas TaxID=53246 RepID=A0A8T6YPZ4_9GAMM|nr:hypothetical protein [Pseudoalteromonas galatheae]RXE85353.1 hypothetical protein DRB05_16525 [Pseudoalteromonas sp. A757]
MGGFLLMPSETQLLEFFHTFLLARGVAVKSEQLQSFNFMESGLLDSFEMLSMVMQIETDFGVRLTPEQMLRPGSATVGGLIDVILRS